MKSLINYVNENIIVEKSNKLDPITIQLDKLDDFYEILNALYDDYQGKDKYTKDIVKRVFKIVHDAGKSANIEIPRDYGNGDINKVDFHY